MRLTVIQIFVSMLFYQIYLCHCTQFRFWFLPSEFSDYMTFPLTVPFVHFVFKNFLPNCSTISAFIVLSFSLNNVAIECATSSRDPLLKWWWKEICEAMSWNQCGVLIYVQREWKAVSVSFSRLGCFVRNTLSILQKQIHVHALTCNDTEDFVKVCIRVFVYTKRFHVTEDVSKTPIDMIQYNWAPNRTNKCLTWVQTDPLSIICHCKEL